MFDSRNGFGNVVVVKATSIIYFYYKLIILSRKCLKIVENAHHKVADPNYCIKMCFLCPSNPNLFN